MSEQEKNPPTGISLPSEKFPRDGMHYPPINFSPPEFKKPEIVDSLNRIWRELFGDRSPDVQRDLLMSLELAGRFLLGWRQAIDPEKLERATQKTYTDAEKLIAKMPDNQSNQPKGSSFHENPSPDNSSPDEGFQNPNLNPNEIPSSPKAPSAADTVEKH